MSGWVDTNSKLSVRDGRVEVRALLPPPTFRVWPSSFLISDKNNRDTGLCWPLSTEIDLYEVAGGFSGSGQLDTGLGTNALCGSYHWGTQCFADLGFDKTGCVASELDYAASFHVYAAEWNATTITYFVDDKPFFVQDEAHNPGIALPAPDAFVIILQTALAWWILPQDIAAAPPQFPPGQDYAFHFIDYVRAWRRV